jgi:hypothetical protein
MTQHPSPEEAIQEAVEHAERACQAAIEVTLPAYRGFLTFIRQYKRVAGTKTNPVFAAIRLPYMSVDGRVKMALDEHREQGASLAVQTQFEVEPASNQLLCRATVASALLGTATAHARVFLNGAGVDATNPLENAETSAIGRALGFLGYGLYGTGIASAEEVLQATAARDTPRASDDTVVPDMPSPDGRPPSDRQREFLRDLLERAGVPDEEAKARLAALATSREASLLIDQLREQVA